MIISRDKYLNRLIDREQNKMVKVVTGIRRCGKSFLLFNLFHNYLLEKGVKKEQIIEVALDDIKNRHLREGMALYNYVTELVTNDKQYYVILDEVQLVENFMDCINGLNRVKNIDLYVTGSNSRFLSSDILTEFRGRGDEVRIYPLSFSEFLSVYNGPISSGWNDYYTFGGLPQLVYRKSDESKMSFLQNLNKEVYLRDIIERNNIRRDNELSVLVDIVSSSVGSLTNPLKLANTFSTLNKMNLSDKTIKSYLDALEEAFYIEGVKRFDVKGKKYINTPLKFYFTDIGLRNARLNFRQQEENHIMENIVFNELKTRGYNVDIGVVDVQSHGENGKMTHKQLEIDFIVNKGNRKHYIQVAYKIPDTGKLLQEQRSLLKINDSFRKIIIQKDDVKMSLDENGIATMSLFDFLLNENSLDA